MGLLFFFDLSDDVLAIDECFESAYGSKFIKRKNLAHKTKVNYVLMNEIESSTYLASIGVSNEL